MKINRLGMEDELRERFPLSLHPSFETIRLRMILVLRRTRCRPVSLSRAPFDSYFFLRRTATRTTAPMGRRK